MVSGVSDVRRSEFIRKGEKEGHVLEVTTPCVQAQVVVGALEGGAETLAGVDNLSLEPRVLLRLNRVKR